MTSVSTPKPRIRQIATPARQHLIAASVATPKPSTLPEKKIAFEKWASIVQTRVCGYLETLEEYQKTVHDKMPNYKEASRSKRIGDLAEPMMALLQAWRRNSFSDDPTIEFVTDRWIESVYPYACACRSSDPESYAMALNVGQGLATIAFFEGEIDRAVVVLACLFRLNDRDVVVASLLLRWAAHCRVVDLIGDMVREALKSRRMSPHIYVLFTACVLHSEFFHADCDTERDRSRHEMRKMLEDLKDTNAFTAYYCRILIHEVLLYGCSMATVVQQDPTPAILRAQELFEMCRASGRYKTKYFFDEFEIPLKDFDRWKPNYLDLLRQAAGFFEVFDGLEAYSWTLMEHLLTTEAVNYTVVALCTAMSVSTPGYVVRALNVMLAQRVFVVDDNYMALFARAMMAQALTDCREGTYLGPECDAYYERRRDDPDFTIFKTTEVFFRDRRQVVPHTCRHCFICTSAMDTSALRTEMEMALFLLHRVMAPSTQALYVPHFDAAKTRTVAHMDAILTAVDAKDFPKPLVLRMSRMHYYAAIVLSFEHFATSCVRHSDDFDPVLHGQTLECLTEDFIELRGYWLFSRQLQRLDFDREAAYPWLVKSKMRKASSAGCLSTFVDSFTQLALSDKENGPKSPTAYPQTPQRARRAPRTPCISKLLDCGKDSPMDIKVIGVRPDTSHASPPVDDRNLPSIISLALDIPMSKKPSKRFLAKEMLRDVDEEAADREDVLAAAKKFAPKSTPLMAARSIATAIWDRELYPGIVFPLWRFAVCSYLGAALAESNPQEAAFYFSDFIGCALSNAFALHKKDTALPRFRNAERMFFYMNKMPFTITTLELFIDAANVLWLVRIQRTQPCLVLPLTVLGHPKKLSLSKDPFLLEYWQLVKDNLTSATSGIKENFYSVRRSLNVRFEEFMHALSKHWFGAFDHFCKPIDPIFEPEVAQKAADFLIDTFGIDERFAKVIGASSTICSPSGFKRLIEGCQHLSLLVSKPSLAARKKAIEKIDYEAGHKTYMQIVKERETATVPREVWVILVLCYEVQSMPFEALPAFSGFPLIARSNSLHQLIREAIAAGRFPIHKDPKKTFCIVTPSNDLKKSKERITGLMQLTNENSVIGQVPSSETITTQLEKNDVIMYAGHDTGIRYWGREAVEKADSKALCLMYGCGSAGSLSYGRGRDGRSVFREYTLSKCMGYLGSLWAVTDREIDRCMIHLVHQSFKNLLSPHFDKRLKLIDPTFPADKLTGKTVGALLKAIHASRDICMFRYLTGYSLVYYGFPPFLSE